MPATLDTDTCLLAAKMRTSGLKTLDFYGNRIGDEGVAAVAAALTPSVIALGFSCNCVTAAGAAALGAMLSSNCTLTELNLNCNRIGDEGAIALAQGMRKNQTLEVLYLNYNQIASKGVAALIHMLQRNTSLGQLELQGNSVGTTELFDIAHMLKAGKQRSRELQPAVAKLASNAAGARSLEITFAKQPFNVAEITAIGDYIASQVSIDSAILQHDGITGSLCSTLGKSLGSHLTHLDLSFNNIKDEGVALLSNVFEDDTHTTPLQEIRLRKNGIGNTGVVVLASNLVLRSSLRALHLGENQIGEAGAAALAQMLGASTVLVELCLEANELGDAGAVALAGDGASNTSLRKLHVDKNGVGDAGAIALACLLRQNSNLTELDLSVSYRSWWKCVEQSITRDSHRALLLSQTQLASSQAGREVKNRNAGPIEEREHEHEHETAQEVQARKGYYSGLARSIDSELASQASPLCDVYKQWSLDGGSSSNGRWHFTDRHNFHDRALRKNINDEDVDPKVAVGRDSSAQGNTGDVWEDSAKIPHSHSASITVPSGVWPGEVLILRGPAGEDLEVVVPQGVKPGDMFDVLIRD